MTADQLYALLDTLNVDYEVVESFEGVRTISFCVEETTEEEEE